MAVEVSDVSDSPPALQAVTLVLFLIRVMIIKTYSSDQSDYDDDLIMIKTYSSDPGRKEMILTPEDVFVPNFDTTVLNCYR